MYKLNNKFIFLILFVFGNLAYSQPENPKLQKKRIFTRSEEASNEKNTISIKKQDDQIYIEGISCVSLKNLRSALNIWQKKFLEKNENTPEENCIKTAQGYKLLVTASIPTHLHNHLERCPKVDGPNCWNAALVATKILDSFRYTDSTEFTFWLNSPLCRELRTTEALIPGDVGSISGLQTFGPEDEALHSHGFIYLNQETAFEKPGLSKTDGGLQFSSLQKIINTYKVKPECTRVKSNTYIKECKQQINYYRCTSLEDYLKDKPELNKKYSCYSNLMNLEKNIEKYLFNKHKECPSYQELKNEFKKINDTQKSKNDNFTEESINQKINSINQQIEIIDFHNSLHNEE